MAVTTNCSYFVAELQKGGSKRVYEETDRQRTSHHGSAVGTWRAADSRPHQLPSRTCRSFQYDYVRRLEMHGMIRHKELSAKFYLYDAAVTREQYINAYHKENVDKFFDGSYMDFISNLVKEHEVSIEELKELIRMVEEE